MSSKSESKSITTGILKEICRLCTKSNRKLCNIFTECSSLECTISEAVMECIPINLSPTDGLPNSVCNHCISKLNSAYNFRMLCLDSDLVLKEYQNTVSIFDEKEQFELELKEEANVKDENLSDTSESQAEQYYIAVECDETDPQLLDLNKTKIEIENDENSTLDDVKAEASSDSEKKSRRSTRKRRKVQKSEDENEGDGPPPCCKQCKMTFVSQTNLIRHLTTHSGEKPYSCEVCDKKFATPAYVKSHMVIHSKERKYSCDICGKTFMFSSDRTIHMRKHTGERPYVCETCAKGFVSSSALNAHRFKHGPKRFFCCVCKKGFTYKLELSSHILIHKKDKFIIYDDNFKIGTKIEIQNDTNDLITILNKKDRPPVSIARSNYEQFLAEIEKLQKTSKTQEFTCDVCDKVLSSSSNLYRHKLIHSGLKPHVCEICNKGFKLKVDLVNHKNRHLGIRNISCEYCSKMFASRSDYGKHVSTHMNHKPFICDICSKSYYNVYALNYHKKQHMHPFMCNHVGCSKSYPSEEKLSKHLKVHDESKRKYRCELCDKILSNMNSLARHVRKVHKDEMPRISEDFGIIPND